MAAWHEARAQDDGEPVLFFARRDRSFYLGVTGLSVLVIAPLAVLAPGLFLAGLGLLSMSAWAGMRVFRFEVTAREIRWRGAFWLPALRLPLARLAGAVAVRPAGPGFLRGERVGTLQLRLLDGRAVEVHGLIDPGEAAAAIETLRRGPAAAPRLPTAA